MAVSSIIPQNPRLKTIGINVLSLLALFVIAFSWLVFPYFLHGDDILYETGEEVRSERFNNFSLLNSILTRKTEFPGGAAVSALYTPEEYFDYAGHGREEDIYRPDKYIVFIVKEDMQKGDLPAGLPETVLRINGTEYHPVSVEGNVITGHQRKTVVRFALSADNGQPVIDSETERIVLDLVNAAGRYTESGAEAGAPDTAWSWDLPPAIPADMKSGGRFNKSMLLSMAAGLLSSLLTPCLMQLVLVFFAAVAGLSVKEVMISGRVTPAVRYGVLKQAILFILVFITLFILTGALIGYAGKEAQVIFADFRRPVGGIAGAVMILFGLWVGIRAGAPLVCKLPGAALVEKMKGKGKLGMFTVAIALGLGCMSCYTGYIMATLLIYIGTLDSAFNGAVLLGLFACGVAVPFLLAAVSFTWMRNLYEFINEHSKVIGSVCALMITAFGMLLVTDYYHSLSDLVYPYLGLD